MNKIISKEFITELLFQTDIVELISNKINVHKKGKNFSSLCPFHKEDHPSFIINKEKQFFYCFGCGIHGNAIDFLMNHDNLNFIESIEELSYICNIKIPYKKFNNNLQKNIIKRKKIYEILKIINIFYQKNLKNTKNESVKNFLKEKNLNNDIIKKFNVGLSTSESKDLIKFFNYNKEKKKLLVESGMIIINKKKQYYNHFRNRIMFPIKNKIGNIVGFGGRSLNNEIPKYINSPETKIFHKKKQLYGLYEIQKKNKNPKKIIIVEGYTDVITLTQYKIDFTVASLGIHISKEQIEILFRITDNIICCYDGDKAGKKATWNTLKSTLPYIEDTKQINFIILPKGEDPDSLIRKIGTIKFKKIIKNSTPLSEFLFKKLLKKIKKKYYNEITKLNVIALPLIEKIPGKITKTLLKQKLNKIQGIIYDPKLEKQINILYPRKIKLNSFDIPIKTGYNIIKILIALLIQNPKLINLINNKLNNKEIKKLKIPGIKIFIHLTKYCKKIKKINTGQLLELYRGNKYYRIINHLSTWDHMIKKKDQNLFLNDGLNKIYKFILQKQQNKLLKKAKTDGLNKKNKIILWNINKTLAKINNKIKLNE
ncbi:DNA primase [Candidatus Purcelliella pentastirinorum]|nr:DNA primase [Candidatus Purcelliella pentastirinorum]